MVESCAVDVVARRGCTALEVPERGSKSIACAARRRQADQRPTTRAIWCRCSGSRALMQLRTATRRVSADVWCDSEATQRRLVRERSAMRSLMRGSSTGAARRRYLTPGQEPVLAGVRAIDGRGICSGKFARTVRPRDGEGDAATMARALRGNWRQHAFALSQAWGYDFGASGLLTNGCGDAQDIGDSTEIARRGWRRPACPANVRLRWYMRVDLGAIPTMGERRRCGLAELGGDPRALRRCEQFCSWLWLRRTRISGGKGAEGAGD